MDQDRFWDIISQSCRSGLYNPEDWNEKLQAELQRLEPSEIIEWNHIFDHLAAKAYTTDLWGAAYLINGGASDDGFYYFRCWLIGMGRDVYEAAIANPDSLAEVTDPQIDAESGIFTAAHEAWMAVTGRPDTAPYPARNEHADLREEDWNFEDYGEVRRRLPRLAAIYLE